MANISFKIGATTLKFSDSASIVWSNKKVGDCSFEIKADATVNLNTKLTALKLDDCDKITRNDTIISAFGKLQCQINALGSGGTVSEVLADDLTPLFTTSVGLSTTTPTISFARISQNQNLFYASPNGASGLPTFRSIANTDLAPNPTGAKFLRDDMTWQNVGGGGGGTVTSFSSGDLAPLFTTNVATATTTPALTFALSNAGANSWLGNNTGIAATPTYNSAGALTKTDDTNVTLTLGGSPTTALLNTTSLTLGWTGTLADARIASAATWNAKVSSVSGTANRITSSGGITPIIDISASYVGQTSLTTLGIITTGVWNGTAIANANLANSSITLNGNVISLGGSDILVLASADFSNQGTTTTLLHGNAAGNPSWSQLVNADITTNTITYGKLQQAATLTLLGNPTGGTADLSEITLGAGLNFVGTTLVATGSGGTVTSVSGTANRVTSTGGNAPVIDISAAYVGQASITTTGTLTSGATGAGFTIALTTSTVTGTLSETHGGTNQTSYVLGDTLYSSATNTLSKLSGNITTTREFLRQAGNGSISAAPAWDTLVAGDIPDLSGTYGDIYSDGHVDFTGRETFQLGLKTDTINEISGSGVTVNVSGAVGFTVIASKVGMVLNDATQTVSIFANTNKGFGTDTTGAWYPLTDGGNIGLSGTNRIGTIYMASTIDYVTNMNFSVGGAPTFVIDINGIVTTGGWNGAAIADAYISSSATWNSKQAGDATLTALAAYNTNGLLTQTAADTFTGRTITGTTNKIDVSNGNGVSGNPTITISATYVGQNSITTLGTVTTGTLSTGTIIGGVTMTLGSDATGDIYYRNSGGLLTRLGVGSNTQVLTLASGLPSWATPTTGTVTSVSGTANRVTSTGGSTPAIDISATFEALLGKVASPLSQFAATTSAQLLGVISDETGTGALVFANTPTLVTPVLGAATATSINGLTITASTGIVTITNLKTLSVTNTLTFSGTDGSTLNISAGGTLGSNAFTSTAYAPIASPTFTGTVTIPTPFTLGATSVTSTGTQLNYLNAATGTTGTTSTNLVFSTSPTLVTPTIGAATATSINGLTFTASTGTLTLSTFTLTVTGTASISGTNTGDQTIASLSPLTTKGDIFTFSTVNARLAVASGDGKILQVSSGSATGLAWSTPTYPSASGTSGKFMISDGTNNVYSTSTIPTSAGATAGKIVVSDGTNYVLSTPTFPNASATSGKIIKSDGTNWIASTETYAAPGTSGNVLTSDGTNWTSAAATIGAITVGTTSIASGSGTRLVYETSGNKFGEITGATSDGTSVTFGSANLLATSPKITTQISDTNGNAMITFSATASAVDTFTITNAATANPATVKFQATGSDSNINALLSPKGTGRFQISDGTDLTKILQFNLSGASTATSSIFLWSATTSKTLTFPDVTSTVAVLGLAQNFTAVTSFNALLRVGAATTTSLNYRTTNGGANLTADLWDGSSTATAGILGIGLDNTNSNGFIFSAANGTRQIARAAIQITNLTNTAGSETGDLIFLTQSAGTAFTEKLRVKAAGGITLASYTASNSFTGTAISRLATNSSGDIIQLATIDTRVTGQTAANASIATFTVGASDASFIISANILVTTSSAENFTATVTYTDEGNTARTLTLNFQTIAGVIGTTIAFANGAVPYEGVPVHIRCKASTAITIKTAAGGTYTGATYNCEGLIRQVA